MSKEEFLKIQTCVLKVNLHCDGCKNKVKKILQKIEGVYTVKIDSEQGKVTVSGNVDPHSLIKKLTKNGKHAEIWGAPKPNNNNLNNQFKNMQIDHGKGGNNNNKGQGGQKGGGGGGHNQPKGGGGGGPPGQNGQNPHVQQQLQQLQQLQQMKGFQDLKMPPQLMKDMKMPFAGNKGGQNPKAVKFNVPEDEGFSDEFDDDDDYDDDDEFDDDFDEAPLDKMKPMMGKGHGGGGGPQMMPNMMNMMMKGPGGGGNGGNNGGGSGGGSIPVQMNIGGPNVGKKGDNGNNKGGNQNQASGKGGKNGGGQPQDGKKGGGGGNGGGGQNKNGGGGGHQNNFNAHGAKKGGGMNDGPHGMPNMMAMNGGRPMGHMGNPPMGQMSNLAAVQGLPASSMNGGGGGGSGGPGPGYFQGGRPEAMAGNPYFQQQQLAAAMMNQQQANGNERFQPMMYARPPPAVNYMPPYPPYPYPPPPGCRADQYSMFSDENTESCTVM